MMDRGIEATVARLREESAEIAVLEAQLRGTTRRRRLLALKLATAGWSTRQIAREIAVSPAGVYFMLRDARRDQALALGEKQSPQEDTDAG